MADNTEEDTQQGTNQSPGQLLQAQRNKLELSIEDIAKRIHLDVKIVEAIETDNYAEIASPIYARGYLRSYAKIVGADAEQIIKSYNADVPSVEPEILPEIKTSTQASSSDKSVKVFTYLISLALVLLVLIWYQSHFVVETNGVDEFVELQTITPDSINGVDTDFDVVIHPEGWQSPESVFEVEIISEPMEASPSLQVEDNLDTIDILPIEDPVETSVDGQDTLLLQLSEDSWIEVKDANGNKLFQDLALRGEAHRVTGEAPFEVVLGFSPSVKIEFNGELFDQTPYTNNGIARFTLKR